MVTPHGKGPIGEVTDENQCEHDGQKGANKYDKYSLHSFPCEPKVNLPVVNDLVWLARSAIYRVAGSQFRWSRRRAEFT